MEFTKADQLDFDPRPAMGKIFAEGFYQWLQYFSKDREKLAKGLAHSFELAAFWVAVKDGKVLALTGCTDRSKPAMALNKKELKKHLGFIGGTMAHIFLNKMMVNKPLPFALEPGTGYIDFVAADSQHRGQGIAYQLMERAMKKEGYQKYVLEVVDNNHSAIKLYTKLGFQTFLKVPEKNAKRAGFENYLYMEKDRC